MPKIMERLTEAAFGQRRKMLRSSLKAIAGRARGAEALGIDPQRRAETLSVEEFVALARALSLVRLRDLPAPWPQRPSGRG